MRLHGAIRIAIPSFVKLLTDDDGSIRSATLRVLHSLADDGGLLSDVMKRQLTEVQSRLSEGNWNNYRISHYAARRLQRCCPIVYRFDSCQFSRSW